MSNAGGAARGVRGSARTRSPSRFPRRSSRDPQGGRRQRESRNHEHKIQKQQAEVGPLDEDPLGAAPGSGADARVLDQPTDAAEKKITVAAERRELVGREVPVSEHEDPAAGSLRKRSQRGAPNGALELPGWTIIPPPEEGHAIGTSLVPVDDEECFSSAVLSPPVLVFRGSA